MTYVRMNYFEYISKEAGDELEAQYIKNAPINFPDATALVFLRTSPTTVLKRPTPRSAIIWFTSGSD